MGAFVAGSIVGKLLLDKTGWNASVREVTEKDKKGLSGAINSISREMTQMGKTMTYAGGIIVAGFGAILESTARAGEEIFELSQKLGISTELLSGYKLAAENSGTSLESFARSMGLLAKNMVSFDMEAQDTNDALRVLGISTTDNSGKLKGLDIVMLEVAERFHQMEDGAMKAALAKKIFGRAGIELIPMLNLGSEGLKKQREEAERLGIVFSKDAAKSCDDFNDRLKELKEGIGGVSKELAMQLMPMATALIIRAKGIVIGIREWVAEHPALVKWITESGLKLGLLLTGAGMFLIMIPKLVTGIRLLTASYGGLGAALMIAYGAYKLLEKIRPGERISEEVAAYGKLTKAIGYWSDFEDAAVRASIAKREELHAVWDKYGQDTLETFKAIAEGKEGEALKKFLDELSGGHAKALLAAEDQKSGLEDLTSAVGKFIPNMQVTNQKFIELRNQLTDEIKQSTLKEYEYEKWALAAKHEERKRTILADITGEKERGAALILAEKSYETELAALTKKHRETELQGKIDLAKQIYDNAHQMAVDRIEIEKGVANEMQEVDFSIRLMRVSGLKQQIEIIEQERFWKIKAIRKDKQTTEKEKDDLLRIWEEYYRKKKVLAEKDNQTWVKFSENVIAVAQTLVSGLDAIFAQASTNRTIALDNEYKKQKETILATLSDKSAQATAMEELDAWYAGRKKEIEATMTGEILDNALRALDTEYGARKENIENTLSDKSEQQLSLEKLDAEYEDKRTSVQRTAAKQQKAIAIMQAIINTAVGITKALAEGGPIFGPILAVVMGVLGAIQIALIRRQPLPLAKGGIFMKRTRLTSEKGQAYEVAEHEPEVLAPLSKFSTLARAVPATAGGAARPTIIENHIYIDGREIKLFITKTVRESGGLGLLGSVGKAMA